MWYLKRGVILTKDSLARRNWNGNKTCCFCSKPETIQHLFVECHYAKFLLHAIHLVLGIPPPVNIEYLFNNWLSREGTNTIYCYWRELQLYAGQFGSQGMILRLIIVDQKHFRRCFSAGNIGSSRGLGCNTLMTEGSGWSTHASF